MSACLYCKSKAACVQCTQCKSALYCNAECARSHWSDTHQYECATSPIGVKFFFEYGLPLFISSIANGTVNVYDITAQLEATPKYIPQFLDWMRNPGASDGIIRALMGPYAPDDVDQRERDQLLIAVYTIARIEGWTWITNRVHQILPDQDDYNNTIADNNYMHLYLFRRASQYGNYYLVKYLITLCHVNPATDDNYAIRWASERGHLAVVKYLMTFRHLGVDPAARNNYAIQWASVKGHLAVVEYLMTFRDRGVDPATGNNYAIRWASHNGHVKIVKYLMKFREQGVNPAADNNFAIKQASENGHKAVVQYLMTFRHLGVNPAADDNYAIKWASRKGHLAVVKQLLTSPLVNISKQEAQDMWDVSRDDDVKLFWKAYITQLEARETRDQGMERPTKLNKERIDF